MSRRAHCRCWSLLHLAGGIPGRCRDWWVLIGYFAMGRVDRAWNRFFNSLLLNRRRTFGGRAGLDIIRCLQILHWWRRILRRYFPKKAREMPSPLIQAMFWILYLGLTQYPVRNIQRWFPCVCEDLWVEINSFFLKQSLFCKSTSLPCDRRHS